MQLEFVNVSGSEPWKNKEAKKFVRSHAMKDFRRRQREGVVGSGKGKSCAAGTRLISISAVLWLNSWKMRLRNRSLPALAQQIWYVIERAHNCTPTKAPFPNAANAD